MDNCAEDGRLLDSTTCCQLNLQPREIIVLSLTRELSTLFRASMQHIRFFRRLLRPEREDRESPHRRLTSRGSSLQRDRA